jgi:hypothetical protein
VLPVFNIGFFNNIVNMLKCICKATLFSCILSCLPFSPSPWGLIELLLLILMAQHFDDAVYPDCAALQQGSP